MDAGIQIYRVTEAGVSLHAQVTGTRCWKGGSLN